MSDPEIVPLRTAHMPEFVDPLESHELDTSFSETRRLRHDGWTPEKKRLFLERFAECGIIVEACEAVGMSAKAAYNLRDRDPLFAAGLDAACVKARAPLADEAYSRARNGVVERIYKDGVIVAERHRYDNRLTMAVLARLDARIDRAEAKGSPHLAIVQHWEDYLATVSEDRREDGLALLAPPAPPAAPERSPGGNSGHREFHELHLGREPGIDEDAHTVWGSDEGWWTDYPPPADFSDDQHGNYGDYDYRRRLSPAEQAVIDSAVAEQAAEEAEAMAEERAIASAQRDAFFGFEEAGNPTGRESLSARGFEGDTSMSGPRRDSSDGTRGGPVHGRGGKSVDDNKKSGGGHGKTGGGQDDNARKPGG